MWYPLVFGTALVMGILIGYVARKKVAQTEAQSVESKLQARIDESRNKEKEILLEAKDKAIKIIDDAKKDEEQRRQELRGIQKRLEKRETLFDQKLIDLESKQNKLQDKAKQIEEIKNEINKIKEEQIEKLHKIASLSKDQAKEIILNNVESEMKDTLLVRMSKLQDEHSSELEAEAQKRLVSAIQRCSIPHAVEATTTVVDLPSDEMKGRIIGREGRNIRSIEQLTGTEIIVDDTPQAITVSGFSPIRRHVAKKTIEKLIHDGRIHPARIEETIEESKKEIALEIKKAGEEAAYHVGVAGLDPKLIQILGRLK